jgi:pyruvate dehydrogenase complex dehydrogenase (E1) component
MIPFYIFYSMFGLQRVGDLAWAAGDSRCRGFLLGATAGRTTLNGEGLQHEDGHSQILASVIPNCVSYDPTFSYEVAVIMQSDAVDRRAVIGGRLRCRLQRSGLHSVPCDQRGQGRQKI